MHDLEFWVATTESYGIIWLSDAKALQAIWGMVMDLARCSVRVIYINWSIVTVATKSLDWQNIPKIHQEATPQVEQEAAWAG